MLVVRALQSYVAHLVGGVDVCDGSTPSLATRAAHVDSQHFTQRANLPQPSQPRATLERAPRQCRCVGRISKQVTRLLTLKPLKLVADIRARAEAHPRPSVDEPIRRLSPRLR